MKTRFLYILLIISAVFGMSFIPVRDYRIGYLEILQIRNKNLLSILDSIIIHEKQCVYYSPDLYFAIRSRVINDTITELQIGAFGSLLVDFGNSHYKGCFEHRGHWFFLKGQELNETVFTKTNQRKSFKFFKPDKITNDGKIILRVIEDDKFSFWIYHIIYNDFFLKEMYDFDCTE